MELKLHPYQVSLYQAGRELKILLEFIIFVLGITIGSFLNVCILRLPHNQSIFFPRSQCNLCKSILPIYDLVPIFSYLFLKGRCRICGSEISPRYIVVELLTGCLFLYCFYILGISALLLKMLIFTAFLIVITFIDYDHQLILDRVLIWFAGAGAVINLLLNFVSVLDMFVAAISGGGLLLLVAILTRGGMGGGDIKFCAAIGLWLGIKLTLLTIFLSFIIGGVVSFLLLILRIKKRKEFIPFGPFIAIGAFTAFLYGTKIIAWYLRNFLK